jgi:hypothetical protein
MTTVEKSFQTEVVTTIVPERYGTTVEIPERYSRMQETCGIRYG